MKVYKCDRCGTIFDRESNFRVDVSVSNVCEGKAAWNSYDLCPKCQQFILEWLKGGQK